MNDELLPYYNRELAYLRRLGAEFSKAHPKIAGRLMLGPETVEDPHVSRLVESVAFLNARIRRKLDDEFPELTDALLGVLYPHHIAPIPSMAIVQFECDPELAAAYDVPQGTMLETDPIHGEPCRFRTCYSTRLFPIRVEQARIFPTPFKAPKTPRSGNCVAVLQISLRCMTDAATFALLAPETLRFFLKGQGQLAFPLYETILNDVAEVAIATSTRDTAPLVLPPSCLVPVGFESDQGLLPYSERSFVGYRHISEFFAFSSKYLFFDLAGIDRSKLEQAKGALEIYLYLQRSTSDLENNVTADTFALGCTPVINLFRRRAAPIQLTQTETEYRVVPDPRRPYSMEVHSIEKVTAISPDGETLAYHPFYGLDHAAGGETPRAWWFAARSPAPQAPGRNAGGSEVHLRFVDLGFRPSQPADWTVDVQISCFNRDLPARLPFGGDQPRLRPSEGVGAIRKIRCLTAPTQTLRPPLGKGAMWRLVSQLSLNHLSLTGGDAGTQSFREILRLHDLSGSKENQGVIEGLLSIDSRDSVMRTVAGGMPGLCRGTDITLHLDESRFTGSGSFLFAQVLERFLGLYCTVNSFVRMSLTTNKREGVVRRWHPRSGDKMLL